MNRRTVRVCLLLAALSAGHVQAQLMRAGLLAWYRFTNGALTDGSGHGKQARVRMPWVVASDVPYFDLRGRRVVAEACAGLRLKAAADGRVAADVQER